MATPANSQEEKQKLIQEGRNQVLYLLLAAGDENVAHDNWHPERAQFLLDVRRHILSEIRHRDENSIPWPRDWPDFQEYTYCPG